MDRDPTNNVEAQRRESRLRHQPLVESNYKVSRLILDTQRLLLTVFEEIMTFKEEKGEEKPKIRKLKEYIDTFSESPCWENERKLQLELINYSISLQKYWSDLAILEGPLRFELWTLETLDVLTGVVCAALNSTFSVWSSMNFDAIILNYTTFKNLYSRFSDFWQRNNVEDIQNGDSRDRVITLKKMMPGLLLQMRIIFKMFLMHIGEHAPKETIEDKYVGKLWMEDKKFLRRELC